MRSAARLILVASALTACPACSERDPTGAKGPWKSAILITIDTLRADHLGCYGYARDTSPNMDRIAEKGVRFERALVAIPRTTQSLATILTGRTPAAHGVRFLDQRLPQDEITLAERFSEAGYATGAVMVIPFFLNKQGFGQGFGADFVKFEPGREVRADEVADRAIQWIESNGKRPFFLWIHFRDPHAPYFPPARHVDRLDPDYEGDMDVFHYWPVDSQGKALPGIDRAERERLKATLKFGSRRLEAAEVARAIALYDGEIAFVDEQIGRLVETLARLGIESSTAVAITADHGESLGEHDFWFDHGEFLFDPCLRVPLIFKLPGVSPRTVSAQVGVVDLAPTFLDLFGLEPLPDAQGRSLAPYLTGDEDTDRPVLAESGEPIFAPWNPRFQGFEGDPRDPSLRLRALCSDRHQKIVFDPIPGEGGVASYYQLSSDPGETLDLKDDPRAAPVLREALPLLRAMVDKDRGVAPPEDLDPEQRRLLEEQGYL